MTLIDSTLRAVLQKRREFAPNATFPVVVIPAQGAGHTVLKELERVTDSVSTDDDGNYVVELSIPAISEIAASALTGQMRMRRVFRTASSR